MEGLTYTEYINKEKDEIIRGIKKEIQELEALEDEIKDKILEHGETKQLIEYIRKVRDQLEEKKRELVKARYIEVDFELSTIARDLDELEDYNNFVEEYKLLINELLNIVTKASEMRNKYRNLGICQGSFLGLAIDQIAGLYNTMNNDIAVKGYLKRDKSKLEKDFKNRLEVLEKEKEQIGLGDIESKLNNILGN